MISKKKKASKLGHDPLAWINEQDIKQIQQENEVEIDVQEKMVVQANDIAEEEPTSDAIISDVVIDVVIDDAVENNQLEVANMLDLPIYFGIAQVADVYETMKSVLQSDEKIIEIKAEELESIDAAALQLLIAFVSMAKQQNKEITWLGVSSRLDDALDVMNIKDYLNVAA